MSDQITPELFNTLFGKKEEYTDEWEKLQSISLHKLSDDELELLLNEIECIAKERGISLGKFNISE